MKSLLKNLNVEWVSLVDRAAVRDPVNQSEPRRFLLYKREGTPSSDHGGNMKDKIDALLKDENVPSEIKDVLKDESISEAAKTLVVKQAEDIAKSATELKDANARAEKAEEDLAKAKKGDGEEGEDVDASKAEEEALRKAAEKDPALAAFLKKQEERTAKAEEEAAEARKSADAAGDIAKGEREIRREAEFVRKAEDLPGIPAKATDFGKVLKAASEKLTKDEYDGLMEVLKAADKLGRESLLFKEMGTAQVAESRDDAYADLQAKAEDLRKADSSLSAEQALSKAMEQNPDLQRRYAAQVGVHGAE